MPDTSRPSIVIAHQLGDDFEKALRHGLPPDINWRALKPHAAWQVAEDASVLIAIPPRGGNVVVPETAPPGWPHNLRWIHAISAGVDEYPPWIFDVPAVTCGRGTNSAPIAEFVMAGMLAVEKNLPANWISNAGDWNYKGELGTLQGKTLGLLGFGSIGQAVAARVLPFGMKILAFKRSAPASEAHGVAFADLNTVLAQSDHLVIALPLTGATAGLIGRAALARVKRGVHLVNISRGRIIDHDALYDALESGQVGFATLDVTEPEPLPAGHRLYGHEKLHLSPHISWSGGERGKSSISLFRENLRRFVAGEALLNPVSGALGY